MLVLSKKYQIPLTERASEVPDLITSDGAYEFNVMSFGLKKCFFNFSKVNEYLAKSRSKLQSIFIQHCNL